MKVFGLYIHAGHLSSEILGFNTDGWKKVGKGTPLRHTHLTLHHIGAETEEGLVAFGADNSKGLIVNATFVEDA